MEFTAKFTTYVSPLISKYGALSKTAIPATLGLSHSLNNSIDKKYTEAVPPLSSSPPSKNANINSARNSSILSKRKRDLYEMLGVNRNCSDYEIRSAYKKLALKYHPDHNPSPECAEQFRQLTYAYEILCDPIKRERYDRELQYQNFSQLFTRSTPRSTVDRLFNNEEEFAKAEDKKAAATTSTSPSDQPPSFNIRHTVSVTLEDLYVGKRKKFQVSRLRICQHCQGNGVQTSSTSTAGESCLLCKGKGYVPKNIRHGNVLKQACHSCNGQAKQKSKCEHCKGEKRTMTSSVYRVTIKQGMNHGESIVFKGEGDESPNTSMPSGDLIFTISQKQHPVFTRQGNHLFMRKQITLTDALQGVLQFKVVHLDGRILNVQYESPNAKEKGGSSIINGEFKCVKGQGMPYTNASGSVSYGDLYIQFVVDYPQESSLLQDKSSRLSDFIPTALLQSSLNKSEKENVTRRFPTATTSEPTTSSSTILLTDVTYSAEDLCNILPPNFAL